MSNKQLLELCKKGKAIASANRRYLPAEAETFCQAMTDEFIETIRYSSDLQEPEIVEYRMGFRGRLDEWSASQDYDSVLAGMVRGRCDVLIMGKVMLELEKAKVVVGDSEPVV